MAEERGRAGGQPVGPGLKDDEQVADVGPRELDIVGGTPRCLRVMMHLYTARSRAELHHIYLHGAVALRDDLPE